MRNVAFFNHKGGVGKTTLVVNVGLALASRGARVLFIDADPQANLSSALLPMTQLEPMITRKQTMYGAFYDLIRGTGDISPIPHVAIRDNAWLLPGDIRLSEFEDELPANWVNAQAGGHRGLLVTSAIFRLARLHAEEVQADYVLYDVGPSVGALNRAVLMGADGFVVPLSPDLFSLTALPSVGSSLLKWIREWEVAALAANRAASDLLPQLPNGKPSPLGYVSQQFVSYRQAPAAAFKRWDDQIPGEYSDGVVRALAAQGVPVPTREASLGSVKNLSSLIPNAQQQNKAIFELTGTQARGAQYTRAQDTLALFLSIADGMMESLDQVGA